MSKELFKAAAYLDVCELPLAERDRDLPSESFTCALDGWWWWRWLHHVHVQVNRQGYYRSSARWAYTLNNQIQLNQEPCGIVFENISSVLFLAVLLLHWRFLLSGKQYSEGDAENHCMSKLAEVQQKTMHTQLKWSEGLRFQYHRIKPESRTQSDYLNLLISLIRLSLSQAGQKK